MTPEQLQRRRDAAIEAAAGLRARPDAAAYLDVHPISDRLVDDLVDLGTFPALR